MHRHLRYAALLILVGNTQLCSQDMKKGGWISLFNGKSTAAWRGYLQKDVPAGWKVIDGALTRVGEAPDLITKDEFKDFELDLEWKISKAGNSGILFHVIEDPSLDHPYLSAPEMQVLDNKEHPDGKNPLTSAGSNFAMHAPVRDVTKAVGKWNKARLIVKGNHVEHWLNGMKLLEYEQGSPDWKERLAKSKFRTWPKYATGKTGHIALQSHDDWVAYRNIKIKRLD